jgi:hypothetical protein
LIDQKDETFLTEHNNVRSKFFEISAKLPYHHTCVIQLIDRTRSLQETAGEVLRLRQRWGGALKTLNTSVLKQDFAQTHAYLESVKEQVNNWSTESFSRQMQPKCKVLSYALNEQNRALVDLVSTVLGQKTRLADAVEVHEKMSAEILNDEDIRKLDELSAADKRPELARFRQMPTQLAAGRRKLSDVTLSALGSSEAIMSENSIPDFTVDGWLVEFDTKTKQLDAAVSQVQAIDHTIPVFQQVRKMLTEWTQIEKDYYLALRDYSVNMIDYTDLSKQVATVETDRTVVSMCNFLEQLENDSVPKLRRDKGEFNGNCRGTVGPQGHGHRQPPTDQRFQQKTPRVARANCCFQAGTERT